jgi:glutaredoxin
MTSLKLKYSILAILVWGLTAAATAQTVYRIVGTDGKITFSDKPPITPEQGKVASTGIGANGSGTGNSLPFELRQIASRYPVTLYTAAECQPCVSGRTFLNARGIPFNERTVNSPDDTAALQRIGGGDSSLPLLSIGAQKLKGFSDSEWGQYLDLAGYPKSSALPNGYKNPAATPLVAVQAPQIAKSKPEPIAEPAPPPPAVGPTPSNPAGIKF